MLSMYFFGWTSLVTPFLKVVVIYVQTHSKRSVFFFFHSHSSQFVFWITFSYLSLIAWTVKCLLTMRETWVWFLGWEDPLEKEMPTHFSIHAWKIPWTKEPGALQSMGSQRVGYDWVTIVDFYITLPFNLPTGLFKWSLIFIQICLS